MRTPGLWESLGGPRAMKCECRLTRSVITHQGLGPLGVHMGCGGEGGMRDAKGLFCEKGFPEAFGMDLE